MRKIVIPVILLGLIACQSKKQKLINERNRTIDVYEIDARMEREIMKQTKYMISQGDTVNPKEQWELLYQVRQHSDSLQKRIEELSTQIRKLE